MFECFRYGCYLSDFCYVGCGGVTHLCVSFLVVLDVGVDMLVTMNVVFNVPHKVLFLRIATLKQIY